MRKALAWVLLLSFCAYDAMATNWFVNRAVQGDGTCLTDATHACTFLTLQGKAVQPGDTVFYADCNADASHGAANCDLTANKMDFASGGSWSGTAGNPITIRATNLPDATGAYVKIVAGPPGTGTGNAIRLFNQSYIVVQGIEASGGSTPNSHGPCRMFGNSVAQNHHNTFRNLVCHDAGVDNNGHAIQIVAGANNLVEDNFTFGVQRKSIEVISGSTGNTLRRNINIMDGSVMTSGAQGTDPLYNSDTQTVEDNIAFLRDYGQIQSYRLQDAGGCQYCSPAGTPTWGSYPGAPHYTCSASPTCFGTQFNNYENEANYGFGHTNGDGRNGGKVLGNIVISRSTDRHSWRKAFYFADYDNLTVQDNIAVVGVAPLYSNGAMGFFLGNCVDPSCSTPKNLVFTNNTAIAPTASSIGSQWTSTNFISASTLGGRDLYQGAHATVGANVCFAYVDGVLTSTPRWNLYTTMTAVGRAAMLQNGYPDLDAMSEVFVAIGQAPAPCGGPIPTPTPSNTPTATPTVGGPTRTPTPLSPICSDTHIDYFENALGQIIRKQELTHDYDCTVPPPHRIIIANTPTRTPTP